MAQFTPGVWFVLAASSVVLLCCYLALSWEALAARLARRRRGGHRRGGYLPRSVFTAMKGRGTRTQGTATTEGCSFYSLRGARSEGLRDRIALHPASSFTGRGSFGSGTDDRSERMASGPTRRDPVGFGDTR